MNGLLKAIKKLIRKKLYRIVILKDAESKTIPYKGRKTGFNINKKKRKALRSADSSVRSATFVVHLPSQNGI